MKLLLIESAPGSAQTIHEHLLAQGHDVLSCNDSQGGPCRGVADHAECPLHGEVDLAVVARPHDEHQHTLNEMGAVCAAQHRIPTVEVDPALADDEMPSVEVAGALATRRVEAAYAAAVKHELGDVQARVEAHRRAGRVHVTVHLPDVPTDHTKLAAVADRARHAIRTYDPFVPGIDVSVATDDIATD
jgi:hypothetical protein